MRWVHKQRAWWCLAGISCAVSLWIGGHAFASANGSPVQLVPVTTEMVQPQLNPIRSTPLHPVHARLPSDRVVAPVGRLVGTAVFPTAVIAWKHFIAVLTNGPRPVQSVTLYRSETLRPVTALRVLGESAERISKKDKDAPNAHDKSPLIAALVHQSLYQGIARGPKDWLYVAGGVSDDVLALRLKQRRLTVARKYRLEWQRFPPDQYPYHYQGMHGSSSRRFYPDGICSGDKSKKWIYVTGLLSNSLARINVDTTQVRYVNAGPEPFECVLTDHGERVVVSDWGGAGVTVINAVRWKKVASIPLAAPEGPSFSKAGPHPTAMVSVPGTPYVWVALTNADEVVELDAMNMHIRARVSIRPYAGAAPGSQPDGLALNNDRLYVAAAGDNMVVVVSASRDKVLGFIPTGWYPTSLAATAHALYVVAGKGLGVGANTDRAWVPAMMNGLLQSIDISRARNPTAALTHLALASLRMDRVQRSRRKKENQFATSWLRKHIHHIVFILRENKTFDEDFGAYRKAGIWADPHLDLYDKRELPNLYALASRGALFVNFYANGEVTAAAHQWTTGAEESDYVQRTWPMYYSGRGMVSNPGWTDPLFRPGIGPRGRPKGNDPFAVYQNLKHLGEWSNPWISYPTRLYLFNDLLAHHVSFEDFGEFVSRSKVGSIATAMHAHLAVKYAGWDRMILDTDRAAVADHWIVAHKASLPAFTYIWLPDDHTAGSNPCYYSPDYYVANNDRATGEVISTLSRLPSWKHTLVFITEDDTQSGADHVNGLRTFLVMVGPWVRRGALVKRHYSQVDVVRTIEATFGLPALSQWDANAKVISGPWRDRPILTKFRSKPMRIRSTLNPGVCRNTWLRLRGAAGATGHRLTIKWLRSHQRTAPAYPPKLGEAYSPTTLLHVSGPEQMEQEWLSTKGKKAYARVERYLADWARRHDAPVSRYQANDSD